MSELKNRIAPKQSDKTLQERLNEVCKKHGVSTLQDLDWAFCESEKRQTKDCIEADKVITHHKYKRCLALADYAEAESCYHTTLANGFWLLRNDITRRDKERRIAKRWNKWQNRWLAIAEKFKPNSTAQ